MPSRLRVFSSVCIFAVFVSLLVVAQSHRGTFANQTRVVEPQESNAGTPQTSAIARHRGRASKTTAGSSDAMPPLGLSFASPNIFNSGGNGPNSVAVADVNGDTIPDLVVANWCTDGTCTASSVAVLLGNGDGTFQPAVVYASGGLIADSVAVAQLRGAGQPLDIVVANCGANSNTCAGASGNVAVLLGNGDGTFKAAVPYNLSGGGFGSTAVAVADLNGDSKLDLVVAAGCTGGGCVGVLLGNGDGTFQTELTPNGSGGVTALSVAVADVNGDSKPDVVVANECTDNTCTSSTVGVLLGNGDGTFQAVAAYDSGGLFADSIVIDDVNGDGKTDLIVANSSTSITVDNGNVGVLLGNGDGTFHTAVPYPSGAFGAASVVVADVNGDGKPDLVVANCSATKSDCTGGGGLTVGAGVLLGNGDGTFQTAVTFNSGGSTPFGIAVADLNADSKPDIVVANCAGASCGAAGSGTLGVLLNTTSPGGTKTTLTSLPNPSNFGQSVTFTATVTSGFTGTPTGTVSFYDGTTKIGTSNLNSSGVATLTTSTLAVATHSITANYSGDTNFATSTSLAVQQVVQSTQGATTTTLTVSPATVAFGTSVTLTAKVTSGTTTPPDGEIVTFKDAATNTTYTGKLSKGTATAPTSKTLAAGTYSFVASYPGDANFQASSSTAQPLDVQNFTLAASPTTVTVSAPGKNGSTTLTITTFGNLKATTVTGFACSGLPSESTCTFGAVASNNTVSLNIATTGPSALRLPLFGHHQQLFYAILLPGFLGMVSMAGRRRTLRGLRLLALIVVLGLPALWLACGGGSSGTTPPPNTGTPTGTSTVTVSATSGTLQGSTKITLIVQ
jgi:Bacterial Ig-like domain (group 3)/FG-GAP-like repeat/FG-GAP repeat